MNNRAVMLLVLVPSIAWANDAQDFSSCPKGPPQGTFADGPGTNTLNRIATDPGPNSVRTWSTAGASNPHHVFVSTNSGLEVFEASTPAQKTHLSSVAGAGLFLRMVAGGGRNVYVAERSQTRILEMSSPTQVDATHLVPANAKALTSDGRLVWPCRTVGAHHIDGSMLDAGVANVVAMTSGPLAFVANECTVPPEFKSDHDVIVRGSIDVIDTSGPNPAIKQRFEVDGAPVGLALAGDNYLFVTNETADQVTLWMAHRVGDPIGPKVGSLMIFSVNRAPTGIAYLNPITAVNPGCTPSRVELDGQNNPWVSARSSNQVTIFDFFSLALNLGASSLKARLQVGPEPGPINIFYGGRAVAVGNTFRTNDLDGHKAYPRPSVMIYRVGAIRMDEPDVTQTLAPCITYGTPTPGTFNTNAAGNACLDSTKPCGYNPSPDGDFPRNFAADDQRLYVTLFGAGVVQWRDLPNHVEPAIDACP